MICAYYLKYFDSQPVWIKRLLFPTFSFEFLRFHEITESCPCFHRRSPWEMVPQCLFFHMAMLFFLLHADWKVTTLYRISPRSWDSYCIGTKAKYGGKRYLNQHVICQLSPEVERDLCGYSHSSPASLHTWDSVRIDRAASRQQHRSSAKCKEWPMTPAAG